MQVIEWPRFLENGLPIGQRFSSVTVGVFDGVHRGHRALIERVVSHNAIASADLVPVVVTFRESDYKGDKPANNIQSFRQKAALLESLGVRILLVIDFTELFRRMSGLEFLETLIKHGNIGFFAVGSGFRCGFQLDTDAAAIQSFFNSRGISVEIVPEILYDGLPISSSRIRAALADGDMELARKMLGQH